MKQETCYEKNEEKDHQPADGSRNDDGVAGPHSNGDQQYQK